MEEHIVFNTEDVQKNKAYGILAYIGILFLIPLFAAKDSQYARFHTNQGMALFITDIMLSILQTIISAILSPIPLLGPIIVGIVKAVLSIISVVLMVLGIVNACSGEAKELPIIGKLHLLN